ncbi:DUF72 domain-containing protein [Ramlibacter algicola]|uniref:DUF72 domain-containing protein n=1 Tax=Ramlibacter algicola TaxID=2795217 RepID=UPI001A9C6BC2|nr:DUF72 domain-containing protein [Ramlibacter algicola]
MPADVAPQLPAGDSHLARYAQVFPCSEINSSFHRPHRASTWQRWAASVPPGFAFSAKLPKTITHERRLLDCGALLDEFLAQANGLGASLACLLVQMPPSFAFDADVARAFFSGLRSRWELQVAAEPRHATWFGAEADALLRDMRIARVLADPVRHPEGGQPGGWHGLTYLRLHGTPRMYYSSYPQAQLEALAQRIAQQAATGSEVWCIFDNTASGAAAGDALQLQRLLVQTKGG